MSIFKLLLILLVIVNLVESVGNEAAESSQISDQGSHHPLAEGHGLNHTPHESEDHHHGHKSVHLVSWRWTEYGVIIIFVIMIIMGSLFKILFEQPFFHHLHLPESCLLILTGIILGFIGNYVVPHAFPDFTIDLFFKVLLPPIILDSAYSLYDRDFFSNIGSIILFAIVGTILNAFVIGVILAGSSLAGAFNKEINTVDCLVFSSLISAVDPVAVLAIFEEIGVNLELYFIVFGESLLNDGVTVVLYNTLIILSGPGETEGIQYLMAILSFFSVVLGGFAVGWLLGWITALSLRFRKEAKTVEPIIVITFAYLAYIIAETLHWSGILALIACGICQKRYAFVNISKKSYSTVKYGIKTLSAASDSIIFLFLGQVVAVATNKNSPEISWDFDVGFILETLFLCLIVRYISVYGLSYLVNKTRIKKISLKEQFIVAYGGLRGAVGFSLAVLIPQSNPHRQMFITTTIMVIFFTVFLQGGTIKILVNKLGITKHIDKEALISTELNLQMIEHTIAGIDSIAYQVSQSSIIETLSRFDERYIKRFLVRDMTFNNLTAKFEKIALEEHFARLYGPNVLYKNCEEYDGECESESNMSTLAEGEDEDGEVERNPQDSHFKDIDFKRQPSQGRLAFTEPTTPSLFNPENKNADHHNLLKGIRANNFHYYRKFNDEHQTDLHCVAAQLRRQSLTARRISECLDQPSAALKFSPTDGSLEEDEDSDKDSTDHTHNVSVPKSTNNNNNNNTIGEEEQEARRRKRRHSTVTINEQRRFNNRRYSLAPLTINNPRQRHLPSPSTPHILTKRRSTLDTEAIKNIYRETNLGHRSPK